MDISKTVRILSGVGDKRAEQYAKLGIHSLGDLIGYAPRDYIDFTSPTPVKDIAPDSSAVVKLVIVHKADPQKIRQGLVLYKVTAEDETGQMTLTFYNNRFIYALLEEGQSYRFYGKVTYNFRRFEMNSPVFVSDSERQLILPKYPLTEGLSQNQIADNVKQALGLIGDIPDFLPDEIRRRYELSTLDWAVKNIHFPQSMDAVATAKRRLGFDELFIMQCAMKKIRGKSRVSGSHAMEQFSLTEFTSALPFELTGGQRTAIEEIFRDMASAVPMNRLVQGDVGSGKTAVAAAACWLVYKNGSQTAFMAPTEILAQQHRATLDSFLSPLGVKVGIITGSMTEKQKREERALIADGKVDVVVGTHALISEQTGFADLGLIITDEQHRFGVEQRKMLAQKGGHPHKLVMSATPIPRTLALILYGDLDISIINEYPKGRQKTGTHAVTGKLRPRALGFVKKELDAGRQAYIVCPMIKENPEMEVQSAEEYIKMLEGSIIGGYKTALLHGKMSGAQKDEVMSAFKSGDIKVLVSTTVIEVGVDVPNATVIMIESAERFGLSQLHQLRGRVGRGQYPSTCILLTDNPTPEVRERLRKFSSTNDGFVIAEEDMKMRGAGDFFGTRQSGFPPLRFADLGTDTKLITEAAQASADVFAASPDLSGYPSLNMRVDTLINKNGEEGMN